MDIVYPTSSFNFKTIHLEQPQPIQGGAFFTKFTLGEEEKPFYIQLPKCITKQAVIVTKRGKYCDLMYECDKQSEFMNWLEHLENSCYDILEQKKSLWFTGDYSREDIETMMTPISRLYKSGKYILIRTYINTNKHTGEDKCFAYNENEVNVSLETIDTETNIIPLILIDGIKFSAKSFELDIKLIQLMVLDKPLNLNNACLIKKQKNLGISENLEMNEIPLDHLNKKEKSNCIFSEEENGSNNKVLELAQVQEVSTEVQEASTEVQEALASTEVQEASTEAQEEPTALALAQEEPALALAEEVPALALAEKTKNTKPNIFLDIEEVILDEMNINMDTIKLKKPNEVYYKIYHAAREKAKHLRQLALEAILEAKNIKSKYSLEDVIENEDEEDEELLE